MTPVELSICRTEASFQTVRRQKFLTLDENLVAKTDFEDLATRSCVRRVDAFRFDYIYEPSQQSQGVGYLAPITESCLLGTQGPPQFSSAKILLCLARLKPYRWSTFCSMDGTRKTRTRCWNHFGQLDKTRFVYRHAPRVCFGKDSTVARLLNGAVFWWHP